MAFGISSKKNLAPQGAIDSASNRATEGSAAVVPPPRRRRSRLGLLVALLFIVAGTALSVWIYNARGGGESVLALRQDVVRGQKIAVEDLVEAKVSADPALRPVSGQKSGEVVGKRAAMDMAAGSLVTESAVTDALVPQQGMSVVGVSLSPAQAPGMDLAYGDPIRLVFTPGSQEAADAVPAPVDAVVVAVHASTGGAVAGTGTVIDVQVRAEQAPEVATRAAAGQIAVVLDSRER